MKNYDKRIQIRPYGRNGYPRFTIDIKYYEGCELYKWEVHKRGGFEQGKVFNGNYYSKDFVFGSDSFIRNIVFNIANTTDSFGRHICAVKEYVQNKF